MAQEVRRYAGVASTFVGVICYGRSSSFNNLIGKWNSVKIFAYCMFSFIICLAVLFTKAWQNWSIFHYRAHFTFLVLISTTVYSFCLDRKLKTKPDAYSLVSSAAFATMSLCMSKHIECGFLDLLYYFCGVLIIQLMEIKPLLGIVGIGFCYFLVILRSNLDGPPNPSQTQQPQEGGIQNQAITRVNSFAASLQSRSSTSTTSALIAIPSQEGPDRLRLYSPDFLRSNLRITPRTIIFLEGDWICDHQAIFLEIFQRWQTSLWNNLLNDLNGSRELMISNLSLFNTCFSLMCTSQSKWIVVEQRLRNGLVTSLRIILLPRYENFIRRFRTVLGNKAHEYIKYEVTDIEAQFGQLFPRTTTRTIYWQKHGERSVFEREWEEIAA